MIVHFVNSPISAVRVKCDISCSMSTVYVQYRSNFERPQTPHIFRSELRSLHRINIVGEISVKHRVFIVLMKVEHSISSHPPPIDYWGAFYEQNLTLIPK